MAGFLRRQQGLGVGFLGACEVGAPVDEGDCIALGPVGDEAQRVLDARIAAADDADVLVDIFGGVVELVLDVAEPAALAGHQVRVALGADGQDDRLGADHGTVGQGDAEIALGARDGFHLCVVADVDPVLRRFTRPGVEDGLAFAGLETDIGAHDQLAGRGHDVLAALVAENGVRQVVRLLEQDVGHAAGSRVRGRTQTGGPRAQDGDPMDPLHHVPPCRAWTTSGALCRCSPPPAQLYHRGAARYSTGRVVEHTG